MSKYIDGLIFDRVQSDIDNLTDKAFIDYADLNRIETAVKWVSYVLNCYGYRNEINSKLDWKPEDYRTDAEMERLKSNLDSIRSAYYTLNDTPVTPSKITYSSIYQANAIEKIIYDLGSLIEKSSPGMQHLSFKLGTRALGNRSVSL